jgi:hypothetical protein
VYFFNEYSLYKPLMYENAVASARRVVDLVKSLTDLDWSNLRMLGRFYLLVDVYTDTVYSLFKIFG